MLGYCLLIYIIIVDIIINKLKIKDKRKDFLIFSGIGIVFIMKSCNYLIGNSDIKVY